MKQEQGSHLYDAALLLADVEIQKEFPDLTRGQIRRIVEIYYEHVRRMEGGLANYTVDGSGCDL